jgi:hypothetical protein
MTMNERQQRMAERILEDENLRGDLEDDAATALVDWASERAAAAAADSARSDAVVEAQVQAIRQAARAAALSGETEPQRLIALAAARLAPSQDAAHIESPATPTGASDLAGPAVVTDVSAAEKAAPPSNTPVVGEAPTQVVAATRSAQPTASAPQAELAGGAAPKPAGSTGNRPRRKRSRLARFFKRLRGGR